ncbi:FAD-binding oxidoreductase [Nonomuraea sp. 3-1Str]|uniref:NAD(P)/FAD-dependent oxidoreductase n=1 Tax=Nonomuraea sp. 3-1Str TaxID=2929801 RepID=UPI00285684C3|nr:FAD-dependent oxidoreductase [Nonomuraea sp. 3-1Str]MDR8410201.1 FAD-binding oxidoreductase [Nonomuraea sp. 3-1Str]
MRVVVIGSGIVGASAAYHLSRRGADVIVVDAALAGQATAAGAGIVCPWVDHPGDDAWYALAREGARHYPELVEALGEDIGYERVGALLVAEHTAELEPVRALLERRRAGAPEMGEVTVVPDPSRLFPPLAAGLSALHVPGAARVDGRAVRDALLRAAVRQGAEVRTGTATLTAEGEVLVASGAAASSHDFAGLPTECLREGRPGEGGAFAGSGTGMPGRVETDGGGSWRQAAPLSADRPAPVSGDGTASGSGDRPAVGSETRGREAAGGEAAGGKAADGERVAADVVVVAAGAWTGVVCGPLGVEVPVFPRRGQIVHATLDGADTAGWPIVLPHNGPYLLGFPGSRVVVGATVEDVGFAPRVTMGGLDEVLRAGLRLAPGLAGATMADVRVGLRPVHAGGPPLVCRAGERVVVATGLSAYGLTAGPFAGRLAADLALGERPPLDLSPYRPR